MQKVGAVVVAAAGSLVIVALVGAAPPEDVAAYCRAVYPQPQFQARCVSVETAAAERVARAAPLVNRETLDRCLIGSGSWSMAESCLVQSAWTGTPRPGLPPGAIGAPPVRPEDVARLPGDASGAGVRPDAGALPLSPAGLEPGLPDVSEAVEEAARPPRPISEADADRHLRGVLERLGHPAARCTKKQYWPGWASVCE